VALILRGCNAHLQSGSKLLAHHQIYYSHDLEYDQNRIHSIIRVIMPASNKRKASKASKRTATSSPPSNTKKTSQTAPKRPKYAKFINPDTVGKEDDENVLEDENDIPKAVVDVSNITYTLSQSCMIGNEAILEDTNFFKLDEFSYRQFDLLTSRKLVKLCETENWEPEWVSGQAVISRKGLPMREWLKFSVEDDHTWEKVNRCIRMWMEELRKEIKVKLTVVYRKKRPTTSVSLNDEDGETKKVFNIKVALILEPTRTHRKAVERAKTASCSGLSAC
jgi:hypothetical protein